MDDDECSSDSETSTIVIDLDVLDHGFRGLIIEEDDSVIDLMVNTNNNTTTNNSNTNNSDSNTNNSNTTTTTTNNNNITDFKGKACLLPDFQYGPQSDVKSNASNVHTPLYYYFTQLLESLRLAHSM